MILAMMVALTATASACRQAAGSTAAGKDQPESLTWVTTPADSRLAERTLAGLKAEAAAHPSVAELMVLAGKALEGQPYVAGTLDELPGERLCIYLTRTDCILFVETCLALARTAQQGGDFKDFANELRQSRYRDGRISSYADRLHYTTEWARQGEARGVLTDVSRALGGEPLDHPVNYMSRHPGSYPLMDDVQAIRAVEDRLNSQPRYYIPKNRLGGALKGIRAGDIICLATSIEGLDISHVMMVLSNDGGNVRLIHASTGPMKVVEEPRTLSQYLAARSSVTGIQVLRPL